MNNSLTAGAQIFDDNAQDYDAWFDTDRGRELFALELACLNALKPNNGQWLEVGVGSGRFAAALGVQHGIDPSPKMAALAKNLGIAATVGYGEQLPYTDANFDGVLMVCTVCFVEDLAKVFRECARVIKLGGHVLIGFVPLDSIWGQYHSLRGKSGHTYYAGATFWQQAALLDLAQAAGLTTQDEQGCELPPPKAFPSDYPPGMNPTAGLQSFKAILLSKH